MANIKRRPSKSVQVVYGNQEVTLSYRGNYNEFLSNVNETLNLPDDTKGKSGNPGIGFRVGDQDGEELVGATALDNFVQDNSSPITQLFVYSKKDGAWQSTSAFVAAKDLSQGEGPYHYYGHQLFKIACYVSLVFGSLLVTLSLLYLSVGINVFHETFWKGQLYPCMVGDERTHSLEKHCNVKLPENNSGFVNITDFPILINDTLARGALMCETLGKEIGASVSGIVFGIAQILVAGIFIRDFFKKWNLLLLIAGSIVFTYANLLTFSAILEVLLLWRRKVPVVQRRLSPLHASFFNIPPEPIIIKFLRSKYCDPLVPTLQIIKTVIMTYLSWTIINGVFNFCVVLLILGVFAKGRWNKVVNGRA